MPTLFLVIWLKAWNYNCVFTALTLSSFAKFWTFIQVKCYLHLVRNTSHYFSDMGDNSDSRCMSLIKVTILTGSNIADRDYITLSSLQIYQTKNKLLHSLSRDGENMQPLTFHIFYYTQAECKHLARSEFPQGQYSQRRMSFQPFCSKNLQP